MDDRSRRITLTPAPERPQLDELLARARTIAVTEELLRGQRESLAREYTASLRGRKP